MYGAILGDIIGQPYEFFAEPGRKTVDFPLFGKHNRFTDDSVMTIAIFDGLNQADINCDDEEIVKTHLVMACQNWGLKYPHAGYGGTFRKWLTLENPKPYGSYGNGSAMRVSSVGWLYDTLERTRQVARWTAEITHNHVEGIKGAEATASAIWLARTGKAAGKSESEIKAEIKSYIETEFGYDLNRTCDEIRPDYEFDVTCQGSVPEAIIAFLEGDSYEKVVRLAVSLGGDADTQGCIAGGIAEALYGVPEDLKNSCRRYLHKEQIQILDEFEALKK